MIDDDDSESDGLKYIIRVIMTSLMMNSPSMVCARPWGGWRVSLLPRISINFLQRFDLSVSFHQKKLDIFAVRAKQSLQASAISK